MFTGGRVTGFLNAMAWSLLFRIGAAGNLITGAARPVAGAGFCVAGAAAALTCTGGGSNVVSAAAAAVPVAVGVAAVVAGPVAAKAVAPGAATSAPALIFSFMHPLPGTHVHPGVAMHFFIAYDEGDFLGLTCLLFFLLALALDVLVLRPRLLRRGVRPLLRDLDGALRRRFTDLDLERDTRPRRWGMNFYCSLSEKKDHYPVFVPVAGVRDARASYQHTRPFFSRVQAAQRTWTQ